METQPDSIQALKRAGGEAAGPMFCWQCGKNAGTRIHEVNKQKLRCCVECGTVLQRTGLISERA